MCCDEPCIVPTWINGEYVYQCINCLKVVG